MRTCNKGEVLLMMVAVCNLKISSIYAANSNFFNQFTMVKLMLSFLIWYCLVWSGPCNLRVGLMSDKFREEKTVPVCKA